MLVHRAWLQSIFLGDRILIPINHVARLTRGTDLGSECINRHRIDRVNRERSVEVVHLPHGIPEERDRVVFLIVSPEGDGCRELLTRACDPFLRGLVVIVG